MMLLMRGVAKLSQALVEMQSNTVRSGTGGFNALCRFPPAPPPGGNMWSLRCVGESSV